MIFEIFVHNVNENRSGRELESALRQQNTQHNTKNINNTQQRMSSSSHGRYGYPIDPEDQHPSGTKRHCNEVAFVNTFLQIAITAPAIILPGNHILCCVLLIFLYCVVCFVVFSWMIVAGASDPVMLFFIKNLSPWCPILSQILGG